MRLELSENSSMPNVVYEGAFSERRRLDQDISNWDKDLGHLSQRIQDLTKAIEEEKKDPNKSKRQAVIIGVASVVATVALVALAWYAFPFFIGMLLIPPFGSVAIMPLMLGTIAPFFTANCGYQTFKQYWNRASNSEAEKVDAEENKARAKETLSELYNLMVEKREEWNRHLETYGKLLESEKPPVLARETHSKLEGALAALNAQIERFSANWQKQQLAFS